MLRLALVPSLLLSTAALADVPRVATDIAPIHSLVSRVMEGLGTPDLVVSPGASPHGYSLRPSQAADLDRAEAVFVVGHALTPWLEGPLEQLAADAVVVELLETEGTTVHMFREGAVFEDHDDEDHDHDADHDDGHDGHDDDHDDDDHDEDGDDGHHHDHHGEDPHAWLDPENARVWLSVIADNLAALDPEHADSYRANAEAGRAELADLSAEIAAELAPLRDRSFVVFHDAYQYFDTRFGLTNAGAISLGDASAPSAARIAEIRDVVADRGVTCVFSEPQFNPGLVETVLAGSGANTTVIDPLGTDLPLGPTLYPALLRQITSSIADCL